MDFRDFIIISESNSYEYYWKVNLWYQLLISYKIYNSLIWIKKNKNKNIPVVNWICIFIQWIIHTGANDCTKVWHHFLCFCFEDANELFVKRFFKFYFERFQMTHYFKLLWFIYVVEYRTFTQSMTSFASCHSYRNSRSLYELDIDSCIRRSRNF